MMIKRSLKFPFALCKNAVLSCGPWKTVGPDDDDDDDDDDGDDDDDDDDDDDRLSATS